MNAELESRGSGQPMLMAGRLTFCAVLGGLATFCLLVAAVGKAVNGGDWAAPAGLAGAAGFMTLVLAALAVLLRWCAARFELAAQQHRGQQP